MKIKKGDKIVVIRGKNRGKTGKVVAALPREQKIVAEGINLHKKHHKARKQGEKGQIVEVSSPFAVSNAKLICTNCDKATIVKYNFDEKGRKQRICKKCKKSIQ